MEVCDLSEPLKVAVLWVEPLILKTKLFEVSDEE